MSNRKRDQQYRHNHYVPVWYQERFLPPDQDRFWYLDLKPDVVTSGHVRYTRRDLLHWGPRQCFAQNDLYTTNWGNALNTEIERFFFGKLDAQGKAAVEYFGSFKHPSADGDMFNAFVPYISVQKLRTPKGLEFLQGLARSYNRDITLMMLQRLQNMFCAVWSECVWQLADVASASPTKLIISDHPVTTCNRNCFPESARCQGCNDPDIRLVATHTYFPLSLDRVLIMTNLSWVRNPYQNELTMRPNPSFFRDSIFNFLDIQTHRVLTEREVLEINYITKRRASRYIAAAEKEWLYPERRLGEPHWRKLGDGYLLMPDPRHVYMGGEVIIGYTGGRSDSFSEYGHKPWQKDFKNEERDRRDTKGLERFKAEWAAMTGSQYRGVSYQFGSKERPPRLQDSEDMHAHYLEVDERNRALPGERQRRRRLMR